MLYLIVNQTNRDLFEIEKRPSSENTLFLTKEKIAVIVTEQLT
jgi:hypothetical protein